MYGSTAITPAELSLDSQRILTYNENQNLWLIRENLNLIEEGRTYALKRSERYKQQIRDAYNKKVQIHRFLEEDLVLKRAYVLKPTGKLDLNWEGPYIVKEVLKREAYELKDMEGRVLPRPWNINNLKNCIKF